MSESLFDRLGPIGFNVATMQALVRLGEHEASPVRIVEVHRETVRVHDGSTEHSARLHPSLVHALADEDQTVAVGDWALAAPDDFGELWVQRRVPPLNRLARRDAHGTRHALVSNVDTAFLVMGLDADFNPRRLERYLAIVQPSGVLPVVVLTKCDLAHGRDLDATLAELCDRLSGRVSVHAINGLDPRSVDELAPWLAPGQTVVVLGSSGAGKSTLTNTLAGTMLQSTGAVRATDDRGQHTTTARTLAPLPGGACVIDTPGLRALRPDIDEDDLDASFADIAALAPQCRFRDCSHQGEPGCAVRGQIAPDRLRNYEKLLREIRRESMDALDRRRQIGEWKVRERAMRVRMKIKR